MSRRSKSKQPPSSQANTHGLLSEIDALGGPHSGIDNNVEHIDDLKQAPHAPRDDSRLDPASTAALSPPGTSSGAQLHATAAAVEGNRSPIESTAAETGSPSEDVRFQPLNHRYHVTERPYTTTSDTPTTTTTTFHRSQPSADDMHSPGAVSSDAGAARTTGFGTQTRVGSTSTGTVQIDLQPYPSRGPGGAAVAAATAAAAGSGRAYRAQGFRDSHGGASYVPNAGAAGTGVGGEAADEYEWEDIHEVRTPRDSLGQYKKEIATVIFLLIIGVVCTSVGISRITASDSDGGVVLLIVGGLTLIPGVYYAVKFTLAYRAGTPFSLLIMPNN